MNWTELENIVDEDTRSIWWRIKHGKVQIRCVKCDRFFKVPKDVTFDKDGYASDRIYHFCEDIYEDEENNEGWTVLAHLVGWGVK